MLMKSLAVPIVALAAIAFVPAAAAQYYGDGYLLAGTSIQLMTSQGKITTLFDNPDQAHGARMDVDNKHVLVAIGDLFRLDPTSHAVTTLAALGFGSDGNVLVDHNGDYVFSGQPKGIGWGLFRISGSTVSTIVTTAQMGLNVYLTAGLRRDIDDGHYVFQCFGGKSLGAHPMISVAPDGTFTTIAVNVTSVYTPNFEFAQDITSGDFFVGAKNDNRGALIRVAKTGMATVVASTPNDLYMYEVVGADRASAAAPRLVHPYRGVLYYTDLTTFSVSTTYLNAVSVTPRCVDFYRGRNIQSVRTATRKYAIHFSFPHYPGKLYVAAMGFSGIRPGVLLNDGRRIALNPDALAVLTAGNRLPGLFNPGPGTLDSLGEARGTLDVSFLPQLGLPVHVIAVVLDPLAPNGLAVIADPFVMII
jgi:hypothetical protein